MFSAVSGGVEMRHWRKMGLKQFFCDITKWCGKFKSQLYFPYDSLGKNWPVIESYKIKVVFGTYLNYWEENLR